jgi:uncharacterized protein YuzE
VSGSRAAGASSAILAVTSGSTMRPTYDRHADAACAMLVDAIPPGRAAHQIRAAVDERLAGEVVLDVDASGRLLGVEVLFASSALPASVLAAADPAG